MKQKYLLLFVLVLILSVILRVPALDNPLSDDEGQWGYVITHGTWEERFQQIPHPPLAMFLYLSFFSLGLPIKLVSVLFSCAGMLLLYLSLRTLYPEKTAFLAGTAIALSPLTLVASLQLDIDGGILLFFVALLFFIETTYDLSPKKIYLIGIVSGLTMLTKYTAAIFLVPFWVKLLYDVYLSKKKINYAHLFSSGFLTVAMAAFFPLGAYLTNPVFFTGTLSHSAMTFAGYYHTARYIATIFVLAQTVLLVGPLCLILALSSSFKKKNILFPFLYLAFVLLFYILLPSAAKPYERYLAPLLIPLGFLVAYGISLLKVKFSWKHLWLLLFMAALWATHFLPFTTISFENKFQYLVPGLFLVPFRGASGPFGFYVNSIVLYLVVLTLVFGFALSLMKRQVPAYLLVFAFALCLMINAEFLYAWTTPDTSLASHLLDDPIQGKYLAHRKFGFAEHPSLILFLDKDLFTIYTVKDSIKPNTTVVLLNFPPYHEPPLEQYLNQRCIVTKEVISKDVLIGKRYFCG